MPKVPGRTAALLASLIAVLSISACSGHRQVQRSDAPDDMVPGAHVITQEDIIRTGARTAMQAIERSSSHLLIARTRQGSPARISHRGIDSFVLGYEILLVVDGSRVNRPDQMLENLPAETVVYIQILSGREASLQWGSEAGNGVILVRTAAR